MHTVCEQNLGNSEILRSKQAFGEDFRLSLAWPELAAFIKSSMEVPFRLRGLGRVHDKGMQKLAARCEGFVEQKDCFTKQMMRSSSTSACLTGEFSEYLQSGQHSARVLFLPRTAQDEESVPASLAEK